MTSTSCITTKEKSSRELVQDALDANKKLQRILTQRAEQLEADLKEADNLLDAAAADTRDDPQPEIVIPGAKKATSLFPLSEFLNPVSPFYEEAIKRSNYLNNTNVHPMKEKDIEVLTDAIRRENQRLQAYKSQTQGSTRIDLNNNVEGLDWTRIAERLSDVSLVKRTAIDCSVCWIGDRHPRINHGEWATPEIAKLHELVSEILEGKNTVDWVEVAKKLGTNRTPLDCLRHGLPRQRHSWTPDLDQRLIDTVKFCGIGNWQLVARNVSPHATAAQCQNRWNRSLDPALRRGNWTEEEDDRLRKAVAGYGLSWVQVAPAIPGRTNDQCRERWHEHVNSSAERSTWTEAEDKMLLENVQLIGNRWKAISLKMGNNRTGPTCRLRYDKLVRLQNRNSEYSPSLTTLTQTCSSSVEVPTVVIKPRPIGKGKIKATIVLEQSAGPDPSLPEKAAEIVTIGEVGTTGESQITGNETPTRPVPKSRPTTRGHGKSVGVKKTPTSLENVPESGIPSSEKMQNAPKRGSKRGNVTQLDEAPVSKMRKTQGPKPASVPASEQVEPTLSLPQSADSTSPVIDADETMQDEHDPPIAKRILRKRKTVIATIIEDASKVPVKRSRTRK